MKGNATSERGWWIEAMLAAGLVVVLLAAYWLLGDRLDSIWRAAVDQEEQLIAWHLENRLLVAVLAFLLYAAFTGASLPGATILSLLFGWYFSRVYGTAAGVALCVVLISFASTAGACVAFLLSRYWFRDVIVRRYGERLKKFDAALARDGVFYLLTLRLMPAVPFFLINVVMGLTPIRLRTYWWASQIGMLPGTLVYTFAGSQLPGPKQVIEQGWRPDASTIAALVLLAAFPLFVRYAMKWRERRQA